MKIRNGFVSNSSSSSFMIAIGVINDLEKFSKWYEEVKGLTHYSYNLMAVDASTAEHTASDYGEIVETADGYHTRAGVNSEPTVNITKTQLNDAQHDIPDNVFAKNLLLGQGKGIIAVFNIGNDEGDTAFYSRSGGYDLNYDIDLDWFSDDQKRIYTEFGPENGIIHVDKMFGAERNG